MKSTVRSIKRLGLFLCAVSLWAVAPQSVTAQSSAPAAVVRPAQMRVVSRELANGMRLLMVEDHRTPIVNLQVWYHVGSKDERPGRTGFAHLFEHMMFRGSTHVPPEPESEPRTAPPRLAGPQPTGSQRTGRGLHA